MSQRAARRLGAVIVPVAALLFASGALAQAKKPRAVFKATAQDFGKVKQGDVVNHEFVFKNEGDATLVIDRVETTCGCTAALVSDQKIAPGKEGKIKTTFDTRGYSGRMTRYVYLVSNDAEGERTELSLTVDIEVPPSARIDVDKYNVDMGLCLEGETPSATIVIKSMGERELKVEMAHENVKFFSGGRPLASPFFLPVGRVPRGRAPLPAPGAGRGPARLHPHQVERPRPLDALHLRQPLRHHQEGAQGALRQIPVGPQGPGLGRDGRPAVRVRERHGDAPHGQGPAARKDAGRRKARRRAFSGSGSRPPRRKGGPTGRSPSGWPSTWTSRRRAWPSSGARPRPIN